MFGPFEIIDIKDTQAYKLAFPPHWKIHNIFQISLLKRVTLRKEGNIMQLATILLSNVNIKADNFEYIVNELVNSAIFVEIWRLWVKKTKWMLHE